MYNAKLNAKSGSTAYAFIVITNTHPQLLQSSYTLERHNDAKEGEDDHGQEAVTEDADSTCG